MIIHWFRQDLRLTDNPALFEAVKEGKILPIYILDEENEEPYKTGMASKVWLHYALKALNSSLDNKLLIFRGNATQIFKELILKFDIKSVYWNRCYEPWIIKRDTELKKQLEQQNILVRTFNGSLLWEPWESLKEDGQPYKVFTPYYKKNSTNLKPRQPLNKPKNIDIEIINVDYPDISYLNLLPSHNWHEPLLKLWDISEQGALDRVHNFIDNGLATYKTDRNFPAKNNTSGLSPYLHFGQISPNQIWYSVKFYELEIDIVNFCTELGWRDFSNNLLYYFPELTNKNLKSQFDKFPWKNNNILLDKWQKGQTGYPIIDAGMRELWQTGFMHNRVRMIVGSFLVKNLMIHWQEGERWFRDCLFDADAANNSAGWQWVAGSGADAAPFFRIFNPVTQGQRFDPEGTYIRKYVPELKNLPNEYLFSPWMAPKDILIKAGVQIGSNYPEPIVDIKSSRQEALDAYASIK
jgi:deoxyribodipyrimidine photo-lyase